MKLCLMSEQIIKETDEQGFINATYNGFVSTWKELETFFEIKEHPATKLKSYCLTYDGRKVKDYLENK